MTEQPTHGARVEPAPARREEEGVVRAAREAGRPLWRYRPSWCAPARPAARPLLASLPAHVHELALEVDVAEVERAPPRLAGPRSRGARGARGSAARAASPRRRPRGALDLGRLRGPRQASWTARRERRVGDGRGAEREAQARADRCQPAAIEAGERRSRPLPRSEPSPRGRVRRRPRVRARASRARSRRNAGRTRTPAASPRRAPVLEEAVDRGVHGHTAEFAVSRSTSCRRLRCRGVRSPAGGRSSRSSARRSRLGPVQERGPGRVVAHHLDVEVGPGLATRGAGHAVDAPRSPGCTSAGRSRRCCGCPGGELGAVEERDEERARVRVVGGPAAGHDVEGLAPRAGLRRTWLSEVLDLDLDPEPFQVELEDLRPIGTRGRCRVEDELVGVNFALASTLAPWPGSRPSTPPSG